jgi:hypothetical protein
MVLTIHLLLKLKSRMSRAIPLLPLCAFGTCYRAKFTLVYDVEILYAIGINLQTLVVFSYFPCSTPIQYDELNISIKQLSFSF